MCRAHRSNQSDPSQGSMRERCRGSWSWHERCSSPRMRIRKPFLALSIYALVGCGGASPVDGGDQSPPGSIVSSGDDLRCVGRFCPRQCPPGATQCLGGILRVCDSSGHWQTEMECLGSCIAGACTECSPGSTQCAGDGVQVCDGAGHWQVPVSCPAGCA